MKLKRLITLRGLSHFFPLENVQHFASFGDSFFLNKKLWKTHVESPNFLFKKKKYKNGLGIKVIFTFKKFHNVAIFGDFSPQKKKTGNYLKKNYCF